ncbi:hypothetical protein HK101_002021 [Irineochytrium annulatum]|nr:hypothetical protein HK101_002021 [Irineochytrium annulatum]
MISALPLSASSDMAVPATSAAGANNNGAMTAAARDDEPDAYEAQAPGEIEGYGNPSQAEDGEMGFAGLGEADAMEARAPEKEGDAHHALEGAMEAQAPDEEEGDAQDAPDGDALEAQVPEDEEGDAQDAPEAEESAVTPGEEDAGVADVEPEAEVAGSHHHGHHSHHNRFHYRKSLRFRHRRRRFLRNKMRNSYISGKKVNYGSTFYHKLSGLPNAAPAAVASGPAQDLTYKMSYYAGQKGSAARRNLDRIRYFTDYHIRRHHTKVRHGDD